MITIEPKIQEDILNMLPEDGELAICLLSQLFANVLISVNSRSLQSALDLTAVNYDQFVKDGI